MVNSKELQFFKITVFSMHFHCNFTAHICSVIETLKNKNSDFLNSNIVSARDYNVHDSTYTTYIIWVDFLSCGSLCSLDWWWQWR